MTREQAIIAHRACCPYMGHETFSKDEFTGRHKTCGARENNCTDQCYYMKHFISMLDDIIEEDAQES